MSPSMTALMCCFARAYHCRNAAHPVFADFIAEKLLSADEYAQIARTLTDNIRFFDAAFTGTRQEAL